MIVLFLGSCRALFISFSFPFFPHIFSQPLGRDTSVSFGVIYMSFVLRGK